MRDLILFIIHVVMCVIVLIGLWFVEGPYFWMAIILAGVPLGFAFIDSFLHKRKSE